MCKSIPLLKDLIPSSEDTIDSCTQLSPLHRSRPAQTEQHFIASYSEIPVFISPQTRGQRLVSTMSSFSEPKHQRGRAGGEQGPRALPEPGWKPPIAAVSGVQPEPGAVLREQQWRRTITLKCTQTGSCIRRACLIFSHQLQTIPFSGSFLPSKSLTAVILTFKKRSYFVLLD